MGTRLNRLGEAVLTSTLNLCFGAKIRKIGIPLHTPVFLYKMDMFSWWKSLLRDGSCQSSPYVRLLFPLGICPYICQCSRKMSKNSIFVDSSWSLYLFHLSFCRVLFPFLVRFYHVFMAQKCKFCALSTMTNATLLYKKTSHLGTLTRSQGYENIFMLNSAEHEI